MAFLLCVGLCGYGVMRKLGSSVVSPLSGRYAPKHRKAFIFVKLTGIKIEQSNSKRLHHCSTVGVSNCAQ